mmetsp:Transcript_6765/g.14792  ORF Transcript_6765/g.14792 Transcript_6765/m.14792 type:complete len:721 (+) Transcript_6765:285-2447(+)
MCQQQRMCTGASVYKSDRKLPASQREKHTRTHGLGHSEQCEHKSKRALFTPMRSVRRLLGRKGHISSLESEVLDDSSSGNSQSKTGVDDEDKSCSTSGSTTHKASAQSQDDPVAFAGDIDCVAAPFVSVLAPHHTRDSRRKLWSTYSIVRHGDLGGGGGGDLQILRKRATGELFALKSVDSNGYKRLAELRQEFELQRSLDHPNIVRVYESFEEASPPCVRVVLELCTGSALIDEVLRTPDGLDEQRVARVAACLLSAIFYMHQRGVVHRDIKPENVMFESCDADSEPKLIDFGLACRVLKCEPMTERVGTLSYMAPELLVSGTHRRAAAAYDSSVDLWSLGATLYTLLCGRRPFEGDGHRTLAETRQAIVEAPLSFDGSRWQAVSSDAIDLLKQLMCKRPAERLSASQALKHPWIVAVQRRSLGALTSPPPSLRLSLSCSSHTTRDTSSYTSSQASPYLSQHRTSSIPLAADSALSSPTADSPPLLRLPSPAQSLSAVPLLLLHSLLAYSASSLLTRLTLEVVAFSLPPHALLFERRAFSAMDKDGSGVLSRDDIVAELAAATGLCDTQLHAVVDALDLTKSGFVDFSEFCAAAIRSRLHSVLTKSAVEKAFRTLDRDGDGLLSVRDVQATFQKLALTPEDLEQLRTSLLPTDTLTLDEFRKHVVAIGETDLRLQQREGRIGAKPGHRRCKSMPSTHGVASKTDCMRQNQSHTALNSMG